MKPNLKPKRIELEALRRDQLIQATLAVIDKVGLADASIILIAKQAKLSTGIIHHYFGDKSGLLVAVMQYIMQALGRDTLARKQQLPVEFANSAKQQLCAVIDANLSEQQLHSAISKTWLTFWAASMHHPQLKRLHHINAQRLYSNLSYQFGRNLPKVRARFAAKGLSALIEGLWLRGALEPENFDVLTAKQIAYEYIDQYLSA
ncbi:transcriptional repressor [Gammaproteobacteria bacterium]|nr:transcriptional repressor [Gammaproteobacteria bacterium]